MKDPAWPTRMSDRDALLWQLEGDPLLRSAVVSVVLLDKVPERGRMREVAERLVRTAPRLRQRVVPDPSGLAAPTWVEDSHFDLDYHLRTASVPGNGTMEDLLALAEPIGMQAFDPARPLWEYTLVEGVEGGRGALIAKLHHSIMDGVGGQQVAMALYDLERDARRDLPTEPLLEHSPHLAALAGPLHEARLLATGFAAAGGAGLRSGPSWLIRPGRTARSLRGLIESVLRVYTFGGAKRSDLFVGRSLSRRYGAFTFPLADLHAAARAEGATVNDAVVAAVAAGLSRYHARHGSVADQIRMTMMVSLREEDSPAGGNHFTAAYLPLDISAAEPRERIANAHSRFAGLRDEPALRLALGSMSLVRRLPTWVGILTMGTLQRGVDVICSNVVGAPIPVYLAGAEVERIIPLGPLAGAAVNVTAMSHVDDMSVGVVMDTVAVSDPEDLLECLRLAFEEICAAGKESNGEVPGPSPATLAQ